MLLQEFQLHLFWLSAVSFCSNLSHVGYRHQLTSIGSNATINLSKYVLMHVRIQPLPINIPSSALIQPFRWPNLLIVLVTLPVILWKSPAWHILKTKGNTKTFHILLNTFKHMWLLCKYCHWEISLSIKCLCVCVCMCIYIYIYIYIYI